MQTCRCNDFKSIDLGRQHFVYRIGTRVKKEPLNSSLKNPLDIGLLEILFSDGKNVRTQQLYIYFVCKN